MIKKLYLFLILFSVSSVASPVFINYNPVPFSYHNSTNKIDIHFEISNTSYFSLYVNGKKLYDLLQDNWITTNGFSKYISSYYSGTDPYNFYIGMTNNSYFPMLLPGQKITVQIYTNNTTSTDNKQYLSYWFVLEDNSPPIISILNNDNSAFDESKTYSYVVSVKIKTTDNSQQDVVCYYTTDGSDPNTNSKFFINSDSLLIGQTTVLKVVARDTCNNLSPIYETKISVESIKNALRSIKLDSQIIQNNNLKIYFPEKDKYVIAIYDIQGNQVYQKEKEFAPDNDFLGEKESLHLSHGIYIIHIINSKGEKRKFKIAVK